MRSFRIPVPASLKRTVCYSLEKEWCIGTVCSLTQAKEKYDWNEGTKLKSLQQQQQQNENKTRSDLPLPLHFPFTSTKSTCMNRNNNDTHTKKKECATCTRAPRVKEHCGKFEHKYALRKSCTKIRAREKQHQHKLQHIHKPCSNT